MKKGWNERISDKVNKALEIPMEISASIPKITLVGFNEMLIENYKGILEYEEFYIKISTNIGNVNINGFNLSLKQVTEDDILIKAVIESFDVDRIVDEEEV